MHGCRFFIGLTLRVGHAERKIPTQFRNRYKLTSTRQPLFQAPSSAWNLTIVKPGFAPNRQLPAANM
jgi:hypothetical protein